MYCRCLPRYLFQISEADVCDSHIAFVVPTEVKNLTQELDKSLNLICETINKYGGVQDATDLADYHFISPDNDAQLDLFG